MAKKPTSSRKPGLKSNSSEKRTASRGKSSPSTKPFKRKENDFENPEKPFGKKFSSSKSSAREGREEGKNKKKSPSAGRERSFSPGKYQKKVHRKNVSVGKEGMKKPTPAKLPSIPGDQENLVRLNRYIAHAGICSRREADDLIRAGVIYVNGNVVTEVGTKVSPDDIVHYEDQKIKMEKQVYLLLNKPKDYITTMDDPENRNTVMALIKGAVKERIYPVGRLDRATTGLLLFTNDGDLAKKLSHPKNEIKKIYHVFLDKTVKQENLDALLKGVELDDGYIKVDAAAFVGEGTDKKQVGVELHSGRNRIVRRMFEHFGYKVLKLDRVYYAGLTKKDLPRGRWRVLSPQEVAMLKMQAH